MDGGTGGGRPIDPADRRFLEQLGEQLACGELVLFTGAGFSRDAIASDGEPLPSSDHLIDLLWPIAFPGEDRDESQLEDVYECALAADLDQTGAVLRRRLQADEAALPEVYRVWFSMPWFRVYTLNVDDLDEAAQRRFPLPVGIEAVSALRAELPARSPNVLSVHLNGRIADFPDITFSHAQYGRRTASPDPWYQHLAADLSSHPVLFVGTQVDEPPFWQQLALRFGDGHDRRSRPPSYLVSRRLPRARRRVLDRLRISWVPMTQADFAREVLSQMEDAAADGHRRLAERARSDDPATTGLPASVSG